MIDRRLALARGTASAVPYTLALTFALVAAGCGASAPTRPSPVPLATASLVRASTLSIDICTSLGGGLFSCSYHGTGENIGAGCGTAVSGVTRSYMPNANTPLDANQWRYSATVRPHELFVYAGSGLKVPSADGWTYETTFAWTDTACP